MNAFSFTAANELETDRVGAALARVLPDGTTVALLGTLGAGKTRLVQAMAAACGVPRDAVVSPTFVLCQEYHGTRTIYHLDAYRLRDVDEFRDLGAEEYFASPALTLIEWADRVTDALPRDIFEVQIEVVGETQRRFDFRADSPRFASAIAELERDLMRRGDDVLT